MDGGRLMTAGGQDVVSPRVLVATVAHRGDDARILHRQIGALTEAGANVSYVAPEPRATLPGVNHLVVRRAVGRRRVLAWWQAMRAIRAMRDEVDIVLVHDLELVLPARLAAHGLPIVWDVHEDLVASVTDRTWIPSRFRPVARKLVAAVELLARRGTNLILAEDSYRLRLGDWPVVPNSTSVPPSLAPYSAEAPPRVVYVGRLSPSRGLDLMIEVGRRLQGMCAVELVGAVDTDASQSLRAAVERGDVRWRGFLPNDEALSTIEGALAGLSLLAHLPNFVGSMPTKIYEYEARGVPVISTPLPLARQAVEASGGGFIVPYDDVDAVVDAVTQLRSSSEMRVRLGRKGYEWVASNHDWNDDGPAFVQLLFDWAADPRRPVSL
jgi:glycosyltransferase involved in cell wall biosynthesis